MARNFLRKRNNEPAEAVTVSKPSGVSNFLNLVDKANHRFKLRLDSMLIRKILKSHLPGKPKARTRCALYASLTTLTALSFLANTEAFARIAL